MHPVYKLPDRGHGINGEPPPTGPTIPEPEADLVADGPHSEPYGLRAADLPEGKTAPPEGDTSEAENIVEKIRAEKQRLDSEEGKVVLRLIGIGFHLEFCKAWKDSVKIGEVDSFSPHFRRAQLDCGA